MGAGCYYRTGENNDIQSFWIEVPESDDPDISQMLCDDLHSELTDILNAWNGKYCYFKFTIESSYYGDSFVFNIALSEYAPAEIYRMLVYNMERSYRKLAKHLIKKGYSLHTSNGAWMSQPYIP